MPQPLPCGGPEPTHESLPPHRFGGQEDTSPRPTGYLSTLSTTDLTQLRPETVSCLIEAKPDPADAIRRKPCRICTEAAADLVKGSTGQGYVKGADGNCSMREPPCLTSSSCGNTARRADPGFDWADVEGGQRQFRDDMNSRRTYQNMSATEANNSRDAAT